MTPAGVLMQAAVAGVEVVLREDGQPVVRGGRPNAALLAALREHRAGIVRLLGGTPEPERCGGYVFRHKADGEWAERIVDCPAWVYEPVDDMHWCPARSCPFRQRVRGHG